MWGFILLALLTDRHEGTVGFNLWISPIEYARTELNVIALLFAAGVLADESGSGLLRLADCAEIGRMFPGRAGWCWGWSSGRLLR